MNNKGFTMIELLAIITVLVTILLVSFPTLINMTRKDKERQYNDMVTTLLSAGAAVGLANRVIKVCNEYFCVASGLSLIK